MNNFSFRLLISGHQYFRVYVFYAKPSSHCPGIQPQCVPVWTPRPTGTTTVGMPGRTALNRDKPCWTGNHRGVAPVVFKILIQPGLTGTETNAGFFRGDPGQHRSSSGMIRLATVRPLGENVVNRHRLCPRWSYFPVWPRCATEESRRSPHSCRSNYGLAR
jgi:hypothetical protein